VAATDFIDQMVLHAAPVAHSVELVADHPADLGPLVIRNTSDSGPSRAVVLGVDCFEIDDPDGHRQPGLSESVVTPRWSRYYGTSGESPLERLRAIRFEALAHPVTLTWSDGLSLQILPRDQLSRAVYVSGTYEPNTLCLLRSFLRPGDVFMDVGANAGVVALAASRWVGPRGHVYAFEPSEREFGRLVDAIRRNDAACVRPIRAAVAARSGRAALRVADAAFCGLNTLGSVFAYGGVDLARVEKVDVVTLDDFVAQHAVPPVKVIKFDVEGAEGSALSGARRLLSRDRPILIVEVFSRSLESSGWTVAALEQSLVEMDYGLFAIDDADGTLRRLGSLGEVDEQNIVALPLERSADLLAQAAAANDVAAGEPTR
jgi:FkbM family methyltransferase